MVKIHIRNRKLGYYCEFFDGEDWKLTFLSPVKAFFAVLTTDWVHFVDEKNLIFEKNS